ncbi:MAG: hypothetical protein KA765_01365 [Thermoflexales bacterium]|nr:hypothetical protein [Thermoflexales bacterium]
MALKNCFFRPVVDVHVQRSCAGAKRRLAANQQLAEVETFEEMRLY